MGASLPIHATGERCLLCTANDPDGVIEHLAEALWESRRTGGIFDRPWEEAGHYWHIAFREMAVSAVEALRNRA